MNVLLFLLNISGFEQSSRVFVSTAVSALSFALVRSKSKGAKTLPVPFQGKWL